MPVMPEILHKLLIKRPHRKGYMKVIHNTGWFGLLGGHGIVLLFPKKARSLSSTLITYLIPE